MNITFVQYVISKKYMVGGIGMCCVLFLLPFYTKARGPEYNPVNLMVDYLFSVTNVMVTDVASPPGAARFYAYSLLGAYVVLEDLSPSDHNLMAKINSPLNVQHDLAKEHLNLEFCSIYAMLEVGKRIMPSGYLLEKEQKKLINYFVKNKIINKRHLNDNRKYATAIGDEVIEYAKTDRYNKLSTLVRYSPQNEEGKWYPTPPAYMAAIDPEWRSIRTFFIQDFKDYKPLPPASFSLDRESSFFEQMVEVQEKVKNLTEEELLIANFWDCNPFKVAYSGHMAIGLKKISPGGHWISIAGIASQKAGLTLRETIEVHTLLAMTLHDAFVSCWEEKYDSDRIRPETAINKYLDPAWRPVLQTPPFPEYTSGHSVISKASAVILTAYFGDDFDFIDTSEVYFGLPERAFTSFYQAAEEAAISRLYGGIHFRDAIEQGIIQGEKIADHIMERLDETLLLSDKRD